MLSYKSIYIPGYTGFIPQLESVIGETYGNATRKLLQQRVKLLRLSHPAAGVPGHRYLLCRTSGQPYGYPYIQLAQDRNAMSEYTHSFAQRYTYDNGPQTPSAIQSTAKVKTDLEARPKPSESTQLIQIKPEDETIKIPSSARPRLPPVRNSCEKISSTPTPKTDVAQRPENTLTPVSKKRGAIPKRQGKAIYRADCGFLPNYTGYIPGQKFSFGKTWGASTRDSLERGKRQPFTWASLM